MPWMKETITVNFDGGSRGNPGMAGIGVVLSAEDGTPLVTLGQYIGRATNNVAEYMGLIVGLKEAQKLGATKIHVRGDSELIIKQMRGEYRVKNPGLKSLYDQACTLADQFDSIVYEHNLRHHNSIADRLANLAMDKKRDITDIDSDVPPPRLPKGVTTDFAAPPSGRALQNPIEKSAAPSRISCPSCGSEVEIKKRPSAAGKFTCPCGSTMM
jgi:ribonuclease HI/DNA-directed RNA polymerase subunit RPC12/RpoP